LWLRPFGRRESAFRVSVKLVAVPTIEEGVRSLLLLVVVVVLVVGFIFVRAAAGLF
jgi:hypothetical protein